MDRRRLGPAHDIQRHGLVRITTEAPDFEVAVACIQRIAQRRPRRMRRDGLIRQAAIRSGLHLHRALDNVVPISHRVMR